MTNVAIYARASTDEQIQSTDSQIRACTEKASTLGLKVKHKFIDKGISGSRTDRPQYKAALAAIERKEIDVLLVWNQSRLGRDSLEAQKAIARLEFHGVRLITCDGYDTATMPAKLRKMTRAVKGMMDEAYLDDLKEATHRGLTDQALQKYWCGGKPYGYRLVEVTDPTRKDAYDRPKRIGSRLEIDKKQAKIVLEIFTRYSQDEGPNAIAADLNKRGVASPGTAWKRTVRRCDGWARSGIYQILRNPLYNGTYYWNRKQWTKTETGRVVKVRQKAEWVGSHKNAPELAIVPDAIWKLAQIRIGVDKPKDARLQRGSKSVYILSGLLRCAECGSHYVMDSATHYRCGGFKDGRSCGNRLRVRRDVAEKCILKPIHDELLAPKMVEEMAKEMRRYLEQRLNQAKDDDAKRPAEVVELDARIARLQDRLRKGDPDMAADELQAVIASVTAKREALLAAVPTRKPSAKVLAALPAAAAQYRQQIAKGLQGNPIEAGRARVALRQLLGERIDLAPAKGGGHLVARFALQRAVLLGVGSVGSGGRI